MKNITHNTLFVIRKLNITHLQYCEMVEAEGYKWMRRYFSHVNDMLGVMPYSKMFWKWWVNEWEIRDEQFVQDIRFRELPHNVVVKYYNDVQDSQTILVVPNKWVTKEINGMLMKKFIKEPFYYETKEYLKSLPA